MIELLHNPPRFLFLTGKGGVGKTSIACAAAVDLARRGNRVLLVSTDPASNVGQVFDQRVGYAITPIVGVAGLDALEDYVLKGGDGEWSAGYFAHEQTAHTREVTLEALLAFHCDMDGDPHTTNASGWAYNWAQLEALADPTLSTDGTQTVNYTPWTGETPIPLTVKVKPPKLTGGHVGDGVELSIDVIVYNPAVLLL